MMIYVCVYVCLEIFLCLQTMARGPDPARQGLQSGPGCPSRKYKSGTKNSDWLWKLPFLADLTMHLNDFDLWTQGETSLIYEVKLSLIYKVKL